MIMVHYGTNQNHSFVSDYLPNLHNCLLKITFQRCHSPTKVNTHFKKLNKLIFQKHINQSQNKYFDKRTCLPNWSVTYVVYGVSMVNRLMSCWFQNTEGAYMASIKYATIMVMCTWICVCMCVILSNSVIVSRPHVISTLLLSLTITSLLPWNCIRCLWKHN